MKVTDIATVDLQRMLQATEGGAGPDSVGARILRRELARRAGAEQPDGPDTPDTPHPPEPPARSSAGPAYVLAVDPSLTRSGFALLTRAGRVRATGWLRGRAGADVWSRIEALADDLVRLIRTERPAHVVIEVSSGHVGRRHRGGGAGLALYGAAVGALWMAASCAAVDLAGEQQILVHRVAENEWTRGRPKRRRAARLLAEVPELAGALERDRGLDLADAVGLGLWWLNRPGVET